MTSNKIQANNMTNSPIVLGDVKGNIIVNAQGTQVNQDLNYAALIDELSRLRDVLKQQPDTDDKDIVIGEIARAEKAAKLQDKAKVFEHLKAAGQWALDVATKIGVNVAAEALKSAIQTP